MLKFRNLVLAAAAATIAIGGATAVTTSPAEATGWKRHHDRGVSVAVEPRRGVRGWFGRRDRVVRGWSDRRDRGWFVGKRDKKHWKKRHRRYSDSPRYYRPMK